jgi:hypothetical protein
MRTWIALTVAAAILLAVPAGASAQQRAADEQVRREAAALPQRLWEPAPDPVSAAGPGLTQDGGGVAPLLALLILLGALGAGYAVSLLRPARASETAGPAPLAMPSPHPAAAGHETCTIVLTRTRGHGEFAVCVEDERGAARVVARSLPFDLARGSAIEPTGPAGRAHRRLVLHLVAAGWHLEPPGEGPWYESRLSRPLREPGSIDVDRALVATRPEGGETEFVALALDEYGNAQVMARSPRFGRRADRPVEEESEPAAAAYATLLEDLEAQGWRVSGALETWYGATLTRRRR